MEHVVFYIDPNGTPAFRRLPDRSAALGLVEQLVNDSAGRATPELYALTPVPVRMRTVFVASLDDEPAAGPGPEQPVAAAPVEAPPPTQPEPLPAAPPSAGAPLEPALAGVGTVVPELAGEPARSRGFFSR